MDGLERGGGKPTDEEVVQALLYVVPNDCRGAGGPPTGA